MRNIVLILSPNYFGGQSQIQIRSGSAFSDKMDPISFASAREASHAEVTKTLQSSVMIRCFRKQKSCSHVIAIPQAGIAAPTLTVMQGFS